MNPSTVLVLNSGSSSVKFQVISLPSEEVLDKGQRDRVGITGGDFPDHSAAIADIISHLPGGRSIDIVGHRVVHGGERFTEPVVVDEDVMQGIREVSHLAPLHNPANLQGIVATAQVIPDAPQVAVFDTAFFASLIPAAYDYPLPRNLVEDFSIRKYGFHGTSHQYVSSRVPELLGDAAAPLRVVSFHLGNGSSVAAIRGGIAVDTSMGMTPLPGLVMGTRSGDIDPSIPLMLLRDGSMTVQQVDDIVNRHSGLAGLTGLSDMRDVFQKARSGDPVCQHAIDVWVWRARHYLGAYLVALGGIDAVVFTGGIGENEGELRSMICEGLGDLGIEIDPTLNHNSARGERVISSGDSATTVCVIPTNEELQIARLSAKCVGT